MQAHEQESPVRGNHVERPRKSHAAGYGKKTEHHSGQDDPTYHQPDHCRQKQHVYCRLQNTQRCIFSSEQIAIPVPVQEMMEDK